MWCLKEFVVSADVEKAMVGILIVRGWYEPSKIEALKYLLSLLTPVLIMTVKMIPDEWGGMLATNLIYSFFETCRVIHLNSIK